MLLITQLAHHKLLFVYNRVSAAFLKLFFYQRISPTLELNGGVVADYAVFNNKLSGGAPEFNLTLLFLFRIKDQRNDLDGTQHNRARQLKYYLSGSLIAQVNVSMINKLLTCIHFLLHEIKQLAFYYFNLFSLSSACLSYKTLSTNSLSFKTVE